MKKILLIITLAHLPILGMDEGHPPAYKRSNGDTVPSFNLGTFLKEHKWHERKDALSADQREEFGEYLDMREQERKTSALSDIDLGSILIDGLSLVEKKKNPKELSELLHQGIIENSTKKVRRAIRAGANPEKGKGGVSSIIWAVMLKRANIVEVLLEDDTFAQKSIHLMHGGQHINTYVSDIETATTFMKKGLAVSDQIMDLAFKSDSEELLQICINHQRYNNKKLSRKEWQSAVKKPKALKVILDNGFDFNQKVEHASPIIIMAIIATRPANPDGAVNSEDAIESIRILLDAGADLKTPNLLNLLKEAIRCDHPAVGLLLERGATL